jgi:hypothetical protein
MIGAVAQVSGGGGVKQCGLKQGPVAKTIKRGEGDSDEVGVCAKTR